MFDRFSENARKSMSLARQEAQRLSHDYMGPEHMLLGVIATAECTGAQVLRALGVDLAEARRAVDATVRSGTRPVTISQLPFTPRAKKALEGSLEQARSLGDDFIGTEHLVLGLIAEVEGIAAQVLLGLGATIGAARAQVKAMRAAQPESGRRARGSVLPPVRADATPPVLRAAREEASSLGHRAIGTEHLLLAVAASDGPAGEVLRAAGATPDALRKVVTSLRRRGNSPVSTNAFSFTAYAVAALQDTESQAASRATQAFGPEHLLLALLAVRDGLAVTALAGVGADTDTLRAALLARLDGR